MNTLMSDQTTTMTRPIVTPRVNSHCPLITNDGSASRPRLGRGRGGTVRRGCSTGCPIGSAPSYAASRRAATPRRSCRLPRPTDEHADVEGGERREDAESDEPVGHLGGGLEGEHA